MSTVDSFVGRRIRVFRLSSGISQDDLARHVGITVDQLDSFEDGFTRISAVLLFRLADCLGVPVTAFFNGIEEHADWTTERPAAQPHQSRQTQLLTLFSALSPEQQTDLLNKARYAVQANAAAHRAATATGALRRGAAGG